MFVSSLYLFVACHHILVLTFFLLSIIVCPYTGVGAGAAALKRLGIAMKKVSDVLTFADLYLDLPVVL
jgi:hypothetical protein